jgi:hypothetical protein
MCCICVCLPGKDILRSLIHATSFTSCKSTIELHVEEEEQECHRNGNEKRKSVWSANCIWNKESLTIVRNSIIALTMFTGGWLVEHTIEILLHFRPDFVTFSAVKFLENIHFSKCDRSNRAFISKTIDLLVKVCDRFGILIVRFQTIANDFRFIVFTLRQRFTCFVIFALNISRNTQQNGSQFDTDGSFRRIPQQIINTSTWRVNPSIFQTIHDLIIRNIQSNNVIDFHFLVQQLCLIESTWIA